MESHSEQQKAKKIHFADSFEHFKRKHNIIDLKDYSNDSSSLLNDPEHMEYDLNDSNNCKKVPRNVAMTSTSPLSIRNLMQQNNTSLNRFYQSN